MDRVDIITGTLGKLRWCYGRFYSGKKKLSIFYASVRPYYSHSLAPSIVGAAIRVIDLLSETSDLRDKLEENTNTSVLK